MGTKLFDYLAESIFFDEHRLATATEDDVSTELARYRAFTLDNLNELLREVYACESATKIFTGHRHSIDLNLLRQAAFYIEQFVFDDPLFRLTKTTTEQGQVMNEYLGMSDQSPLLPRVSNVVAKLKQITPMIAADYIKLLPVSYLFEPPEQTRVYFSENFFEDILAPRFMEFFQSNAEVRAMRRDGASYVEETSLYPTRAISVRFKNDPSDHVRTHMLLAQKFLAFDEKTGRATVRTHLPDEPPDQAQFQHWIDQSINRTAAQVHHEMALQMALANDLKAAYLTRSPFTFNLLQHLAPDADPARMRSATTLLNVELPFVDLVGTEAIMNIRKEQGDSFERFRKAFDRKLRELASIKDEEEQRLKAEDMSAELIESAHAVGDIVSRAQKKLAADAALTVAGLSAAVATGGWTLPVAVGAAAAGYKAYQDYRGATDAPAFFLWKVLQESKK